MKLSHGVEWGLHCASLLALAPAGTSIRRDALAGHYGLPDTYLAKHLQAMTRAGILHASTGPRGGYRLARPPGRITALDVVEAVEGSGRSFRCQEIRQHGTGALSPDECRRPCGIATVMDRAHDAWRAALREVTLADLVARMPPEVRERNRARMAKTAS